MLWLILEKDHQREKEMNLLKWSWLNGKDKKGEITGVKLCSARGTRSSIWKGPKLALLFIDRYRALMFLHWPWWGTFQTQGSCPQYLHQWRWRFCDVLSCKWELLQSAGLRRTKLGAQCGWIHQSSPMHQTEPDLIVRNTHLQSVANNLNLQHCTGLSLCFLVICCLQLACPFSSNCSNTTDIVASHLCLKMTFSPGFLSSYSLWS